MKIEKYEKLTGQIVEDSQKALVTAQIKRSRVLLESRLGYPLTRNRSLINYYNELGIGQTRCCYPDFGNLNDPDSVQGAYRLFPYNSENHYFKIDPFVRVYAVKLVFIKMGDEPNGVTVQKYDGEEIRLQFKNGIATNIEICKDCLCYFDCRNCVQLAVDADWLWQDCLPDDLMYLWVDMVTYESDGKKNIKSETLATHSYTKFDRNNPCDSSEGISIIKKYAGVNGTVYKPIVG